MADWTNYQRITDRRALITMRDEIVAAKPATVADAIAVIDAKIMQYGVASTR